MELKLDDSAIKELFEQYSTPALKSEVRRATADQIGKIVEDVVATKVSAFLTEKKIEEIFRDVIRKDIFKSFWAHDQNKSLDIMNKIVIDEFKAKAKLVNFERIEELVLKECRVMIDGKIKRFKNIVKLIDKEEAT